MDRSARPRRAATALLTAAAVGAALLTVMATGDATDASPEQKIDSELRTRLAAHDEVSFMVELDDDLELPASQSGNEDAYTRIRAYAAENRHDVTEYLDEAGVDYEPFWITNSLKVTADETTARELAAFGEVEWMRLGESILLDEPVETETVEHLDTTAVQWGVETIGADRVWNELGVTGEGIVVANIDSGVDYTHPSLVENYRGANEDGTFDHAYNWYDPTGVCGTTGPCDNAGHGTHVMGTAVGADGVGVAPGATWIAAKGCETDSCSETSLLRAAQWLMAPTDPDGRNPRPDLAPDIINNSWGGGTGSTWFGEVIDAWAAAGIFAAFAAGNDANGQCATVSSPGDNANTYTVGAVDAEGVIGDFSGRGPAMTDGKPDIAAPGIDIVSAVPGGGYASNTGTSMATPHVSGAVALLWSASPETYRDRDATALLLGENAVDVDDTTCGGTAERNHVYGEGILDVYQAVKAAPRGDVGDLTGTVTDADGLPIDDATVHLDGPTVRDVHTDEHGRFELRATAGEYTLTASKYGYVDATAQAVVEHDGATAVELRLDTAATTDLTGTVTDPYGRPRAGAEVRLDGTPLETVTTDEDGRFTIAEVAVGAYDLEVDPGASPRCLGGTETAVDLAADTDAAIRLPWKTDRFGWSCRDVDFDWQRANHKVDLRGDEDVATVDLPFPVTVYGETVEAVHLGTNGIIYLQNPRVGDFENQPLATPTGPNGFIAPFWADMEVDERTEIRTGEGRHGDDRFVVEYADLATADGSARVDFQVVFAETGGITVQYGDLSGEHARGGDAVIGIESPGGTAATAYAEYAPELHEELAVLYSGPDEGDAPADTATFGPEAEASAALDFAARLDGTEPETEETAAEPPSALAAAAAIESDNGLARRIPLDDGRAFQLNQYGTIALLDEDGGYAWRRSPEGMYEAWGVSPTRPWYTGEPAYVIPQGLSSIGVFGGDTEAAAVAHDFNGDGVADLAFIASIGQAPSWPASFPGLPGLSAATMVTVLDGTDGAQLWSEAFPYAQEVAVEDGRLIVLENPMGSRQAAGRYPPQIHAYTYADGAFTRAWTHEADTDTFRWTDLEPVGDGRVAAAGYAADRTPTLRLLDAADGTVTWESAPEQPIRSIAVDADRGLLVATEQSDYAPGLNYALAAYAIDSGERTELSRRYNVYPTDVQVANVHRGKDAEYLVSEIMFDYNGMIAGTQQRVVDGDGDQVIPSYAVKRDLGERHDGPLIAGIEVAGRKIVLNWVGDDGRGRPGFRAAENAAGIAVINGANGKELWSRTGMASSPVYSVADRDTVRTVAPDQTVYAYDLDSGRLTDQHANFGDLTRLASADVTGDGTPDVIAGGSAHGLFAFDGTALDGATEPLWNAALPGRVLGLELGDVDGDGREDAVVATGEALAVVDLERGEVTEVIESDGFTWNVLLRDLDGDGVAEILTASDRLAAWDGSGRPLWEFRPAEDLVFSVPSANEDGVFASYGSVDGAEEPVRATAVSLDGEGAVRWETPTDPEQVLSVMPWGSVLADERIPYADGHAVAFAWIGFDGRASTRVEIRDGRTGEVLLVEHNGGGNTHLGLVATDAGLVQHRFYSITVYDGSDTPRDYGTGLNPWTVTELHDANGDSHLVTAAEGSADLWSTAGGSFTRTAQTSQEYRFGSGIAVDLDGDGDEEFVGGAFDESTYDILLDKVGYGYSTGAHGRRGLAVLEFE